MIEKSLYEQYEINFDEEIAPDSGDYLFVFNNNRELYLDDDKNLPVSLDNFDVNFYFCIGNYNGKLAFVVNVNSDEYFFLLRTFQYNY